MTLYTKYPPPKCVPFPFSPQITVHIRFESDFFFWKFRFPCPIFTYLNRSFTYLNNSIPSAPPFWIFTFFANNRVIGIKLCPHIHLGHGSLFFSFYYNFQIFFLCAFDDDVSKYWCAFIIQCLCRCIQKCLCSFSAVISFIFLFYCLKYQTDLIYVHYKSAAPVYM